MLVGLTALSAVFAIVLVSDVSDHADRLSGRNLPYASAVASAALSAKGIANDERGFLMTGERSFVEEIDRRLTEARASFRAAADAATGDDQVEAIQAARSGFERWVTTRRDDISSFEAGDHEPSIVQALGPHREIRKAYEGSLTAAQSLATMSLVSDERTIAVASSQTKRGSIAVLLIALVLGCAIAIWVMRTILKPVKSLYQLFDAVRGVGGSVAPGAG
jgi:methyl-accepting chemotaxis protein